jgi:ferredoxin--NADP+ reductase
MPCACKSNTQRAQLTVESVRELSPSTFAIRFDKALLDFNPGQHLLVGCDNERDMREYSIYSGKYDPYLEILVKEVIDGTVSPSLRNVRPGKSLRVQGPAGCFKIEPTIPEGSKHVFIGTGTGIAPFRSMVRTFPDLDYLMVHGVTHAAELYDADDFDPSRFVSCVSREKAGNVQGRVTDYLSSAVLHPQSVYYLCGNSDMIYDAFQILISKGIPRSQIKTEVYF